MPASSRRLAAVVVAVSTLLVVTAFAAAAWTDDPPATNGTTSPVDALDQTEPALECRVVEGQEVCDTFGEIDEGPGTTTPPAEAPPAPPSSTPSAVDGNPADRNEPVHDCREVAGDEVCDTYGETDEGPGTYDDSDEGPGTRS